jgi:hypothetical protein
MLRWHALNWILGSKIQIRDTLFSGTRIPALLFIFSFEVTPFDEAFEEFNDRPIFSILIRRNHLTARASTGHRLGARSTRSISGKTMNLENKNCRNTTFSP